MTKSGTESNLNYSIPTRDDDAISMRMAARESNAIQHIVPLGDLLALSGAAEWRIGSNEGRRCRRRTCAFGLSPTSALARPLQS